MTGSTPKTCRQCLPPSQTRLGKGRAESRCRSPPRSPPKYDGLTLEYIPTARRVRVHFRGPRFVSEHSLTFEPGYTADEVFETLKQYTRLALQERTES